jgi:D-alanine-D-alanine ligase
MNQHYQGILKGRKVALLSGGPGSERDVSLRSGAAVAKALGTVGAHVVEIDVHGPDFTLPENTDLAFNLIHGTFGEDGQLQEILDHSGIPYTGENAEKSRIAFDKILTKEAFDRAGVPTSKWEKILVGQPPTMQPPYVVKAPRQGSSVGVHILHDASGLTAALDDCFRFGDMVLVEEFFKGRELTVGILGKTALPVVEIIPKDGFYDYANKYTSGASQYFVPAPLEAALAARIQQTALEASHALGLEVYCRVDILLGDDASMSVLEINTIPGMTELSLLPKAASAVGLQFGPLCEEIAGLSWAKGGTA